jgi:cell division protein FtsL
MVVGIVSVSALLVQGGFRTETLRERIATLGDEQQALALEVAELSSPARVQYWATRVGLVMPERVVVLQVAPSSEDRPA